MIRSFADTSTAGAKGWLVLAVVAVVIGLSGVGVPGCDAATSPPADAPAFSLDKSDIERSQEVPDKVFEIFGEIQRLQGNPPPGYVGGRPFQNRERRLARGRYREYDVNPTVPGQHRGPERLVIEQRTGKAYYTHDHYRTFVPIN